MTKVCITQAKKQYGKRVKENNSHKDEKGKREKDDKYKCEGDLL